MVGDKKDKGKAAEKPKRKWTREQRDWDRVLVVWQNQPELYRLKYARKKCIKYDAYPQELVTHTTRTLQPFSRN
jgi:hypothetical protein